MAETSKKKLPKGVVFDEFNRPFVYRGITIPPVLVERSPNAQRILEGFRELALKERAKSRAK